MSSNYGEGIAIVLCEVELTMSPKNKIALFVLSMAVVALTGFSLSAQHSKQIIDALASAVWGS